MTTRRHAGCRAIGVAMLLVWSVAGLAAQTSPPAARQAATTAPPPQQQQQQQVVASDELLGDLRSGLADAAIRLPIAALLGAALALRPRRASSPRRDPAVIETQIVLAIVGALIMLVVGQSLARAFGIAGAANLIRYRAKIEDPKDAVVMLSTLAVGLASGVGLFGIAAVGTLFLAITLWVIEGFETHVRTFLLSIKLGESTSAKRAAVERLLQRARTAFELRATADDELAYLVSTGAAFKTEQLTAALAALGPKEKTQIEWKEEKKARPLEKDEDDD